MILIAYLRVFAALGWLLLRRPASRFKTAMIGSRLRVAALAVALSIAAVGLVLLTQGQATSVGTALLIVLISAAGIYITGTVSWGAPGADWLRMIGWIGMVLPLLIPSTLTLALPFVALLAFTLRSPDDRAER